MMSKNRIFLHHIVNVDGKRLWLHNASNENWALLSAHEKRGKEAIKVSEI